MICCCIGSTSDWIHLCKELKVNSDCLFGIEPNERLISIIQHHQQQTEGPAMTVRFLYKTLKSINAARAAALLLKKAHDICEHRKRSASESWTQASNWRHTNNYCIQSSSSFSHTSTPSILYSDSSSESEAETGSRKVTTVAVSASFSTMSCDSEIVELSDIESPRNV